MEKEKGVAGQGQGQEQEVAAVAAQEVMRAAVAPQSLCMPIKAKKGRSDGGGMRVF